MARTAGKKEKITFYAPPQISVIIEKIISTGVESSLSEAICRSISEYWILLQKEENIKETDQRFENMQREIDTLQATVDVLSERLSAVERKYSLISRAIAEPEEHYCTTSKQEQSQIKN